MYARVGAWHYCVDYNTGWVWNCWTFAPPMQADFLTTTPLIILEHRLEELEGPELHRLVQVCMRVCVCVCVCVYTYTIGLIC